VKAMGPQLMLGVDLGTTSCKSILVDENGRVIGRVSRTYPTYTPKPRWAEQDPEDWYNAFRKAVKQLIRSTQTNSKSIVSLCIDGMLSSPVYLDSKGRILRSTIIWMDQRSDPQVSLIRKRIGEDKLFGKTYNPITATFALPKILWVKDNQPEIWRRTCKILFPKDYVRLRVTGEWHTDRSEASSTLLYDKRTDGWSDEILDAVGIDRDKLPEILSSTDVVARLSTRSASELGLEEGTPLIAGCIDAAADCLASGTVEPGDISVRLGTCGAFHLVTRSKTGDPLGRVFSFYHCLPERNILESVTPSGIAHKWFIEAFYKDKRKLARERDLYSEMEAMAREAPLGSKGLIFHPYVMGEHSPLRSSHLKSAFLGISSNHSKEDFARSVFEGMALSLNDCLLVLKQFSPNLKAIRLAGGGAKSPFWRTIITDIFGVRTETTTVEDASFGAALLGGIGVRLFTSYRDAVDRCIKIRDVVDPNMKNHEKYAKLFTIHTESRDVLLEYGARIDDFLSGKT